MAVDLRGVTTVLLPGTGSDDDYVYRAFSAALHEVGALSITPAAAAGPAHRRLSRCARQRGTGRPDRRRRGVLGAAVAAAWALAHPGHAVAVLAALPAWTGEPETAPAALAARHSADELRRDGLAAAIAQMRASSPPWLADELTRSWVGQWPALPDAMDGGRLLCRADLRPAGGLAVPMGVAAATDDPMHPVEVGIEWVAAAPRAALRTVTLVEMGADPAALGAACLAALADVLAAR